MCKFIGKSNERILCKLSKSEILRLYSIVHVAMETSKTTNFTCQSKSFISTFFNSFGGKPLETSMCQLPLLQAEIKSKATQSVRSDVMNLSAKDPSITFENVTEAVALLFCHTYSPERDFKVRLL